MKRTQLNNATGDGKEKINSKAIKKRNLQNSSIDWMKGVKEKVRQQRLRQTGNATK